MSLDRTAVWGYDPFEAWEGRRVGLGCEGLLTNGSGATARAEKYIITSCDCQKRKWDMLADLRYL